VCDARIGWKAFSCGTERADVSTSAGTGVLTVVDQWSRCSPILEVGSSLTGVSVADALDRAIAEHGCLRP
jgi:transposase InsO family protein